MEFHSTFSFVVIALIGCVFAAPLPQSNSAMKFEPANISSKDKSAQVVQSKSAINVEPTSISSKDKSARVVQYSNEFNPEDNSFVYQYETDNGIKGQGSSKDNKISMQGSYFLTMPDGNQVPVQYTADENGFRVESAAVPTPHPLIEKISAYFRSMPTEKEPEESSESGADSKAVDV